MKEKAYEKAAASNREIIDSYDYLGKAASAMDCTGLIPSAPKSGAELDSYEDLYPYRPPHIACPDSETERG